MPFPALPPDGRLEDEILERWKTHDVPRRSLEHNRDAEPFVFYEGPPTANGKPAIHHVFSRTLKDTVCRYRQMTGRYVPRKAGWDTQGLPVEIEVQKAQGITNRDEIERLGIAEFNRLCRESVFTYKGEWESLSRRMAYWLDYDDPYVTYESDYIQSCWAILAAMHEAGLLARDFKSLPFCPQCSTGLSNHEVAQGYETVQDPSVFVRFAVEPAAWKAHFERAGDLDDELRARLLELGSEGVSLLVWTTTPWTLYANVAAAVSARDYAIYRHGDELLLLGVAQAEKILGDDGERLVEGLKGAHLLGLPYQRLLDDAPVESTDTAFTVRVADFVSDEDGTGIVHIAPAFGSDDFNLRVSDGLPICFTVDDNGCFTDAVPAFAGRFVKEADKDILRLLKERGQLFRQVTVDHSYPHCWRCHSPLLYMARPSWYIRTTKLKDQLVAQNDTIDWHPPEVGKGRFGEWLSNNVDWSLSRERYWGTPLNVWVCESCGAEKAPASLDEIGELRGEALPADFDPHRPQVDELTFPCAADGCDGVMRRTPEVIDCWFDSGAMPFAQAGWPRATGGELPAHHPADFICEGLDQTRGWFYTLHVLSVFLTGKPAYKSLLVNNLLLDGQGKKMSKHKGNVVDPWKVFETAGADAARWAFVSQGQVWLPKRFDERAVAEGARRTFGTLTNCYAFLALYANLDGWAPGDRAPDVAKRPSIDRWLVSRLQTLTTAVGDAYAALDLNEVSRRLDAFIDEELSNWYVRRNRSRFWKSGDSDDKRAAFATLASALERLSQLMAPVVPFLSEWLWSATTGAAPDASVHLTDWPAARDDLVDADLEQQMSVVLDTVGLGRSVRASHDLRTRQPLRRVLVKAADPADAERLRRPELARLVAEELNVKAVEVVEVADFRVLSAKPDFKRLGPRFGPKMKALAAAVKGLDEPSLERFEAEGTLVVALDGEDVTLDRDDVQLVESGREGYAVAGDGRIVLALDTALDDELISEGRAREIVNRVQNTRKSAGLDVADRVVVRLSGADELLAAARQHEGLILAEVLGTQLDVVDALDGGETFDVDGAKLSVAVSRVGD